MSDRMDRIREFAQDARQYDIQFGRVLERDDILFMLRAFVSEDGLTDSNGDTVFPASGETAGVYRAIELIEMEEQNG
jgi:hypothetical protein